jgi:hypothetical protein
MLLVVLAATALCTLDGLGETYDFTAVPLPGDTYTTAHFRIFIPDSLALVRGVYFYLDPHHSDSRYIVSEEPFRDLVTSTDFGLMGAQLDNVLMESGIGHAVLRALDAFADSSGHAELAFTTLFLDGWSWGGQFGYHFTKWIPNRTIGFITQKGGYHDTTFAGSAIYVPGYLVIGENDLPYRITNLTGIFEHHRPMGAVWILALQPNAGHERIMDRNLLDTYFRAVIEQRLPDSIPPGQPVALRRMDTAVGWLGNRSTHEIGPYTCYGPGMDQACWCPTRQVSEQWQVLVSDTTVTDTIPCDPAALSDGAGHAAGERQVPLSHPNPFGPATTITYRVPATGTVSLAVFAVTGELVRTLVCGSREQGKHSVRWDGCDASGRKVASGVYWCQLQCGDSRVCQRLIRLE